MKPFLRPLLLAWLMTLGVIPEALSAAPNTVVVAPVLSVPFLSDHYYESDAVLDDGSFALSGTTTIVPPGTDGYPQFEVQTFAPDGSPIGSPFVPEAGNPVDTGGGLYLSAVVTS